MKQIWTQLTAAFDGEFVKFEPMMPVAQTGSKTLPAHRCWGRIPSRSKGTRDRLRRRLDSDRRPRRSARGAAAIPIKMAKDAGRDPASLSLRRLQGARLRGAKTLPYDAGVDRVVLMLPPKPETRFCPCWMKARPS